MTAGIVFVAVMGALWIASLILGHKDKREMRRLADRDRWIREARLRRIQVRTGSGPAAEVHPLEPGELAAFEDSAWRIGYPGNLAGQTVTEATKESA